MKHQHTTFHEAENVPSRNGRGIPDILLCLPVICIFAAVGFSIYSNTLNSPFNLDDTFAITDNPHIRLTRLTREAIIDASIGRKLLDRRPIAMLSFALNYYVGQYHLTGYHLVNIAIHFINGVLLFFFIKITLAIPANRSAPENSLTRPPPAVNPVFIAFVSALLWLVNPLHTNSVTYIVQRMNSMTAMFYVLSLLCYAKGRMVQTDRSGGQKTGKKSERRTSNIERRTSNKEDQRQNNEYPISNIQYPMKNKKHQIRKAERPTSNVENQKAGNRKPRFKIPSFYLYFGVSFISGIFAMGCKETSASLPFFIMLYEWYFFRPPGKDRIKTCFQWFTAMTVLFAAVVIIYLCDHPGFVAQLFPGLAHNLSEFSPGQRMLTECRVVVYYISLIFLPLPSRLNLDYDFPVSHSLINPVTTLFSLLAVAGLIGLALYLARKERILSFCILWFFGNLVIESTIIPLALVFEHRTYLPSMLLPLLIILPAYRFIKKRWLINMILCLAVVPYGFWTYERNKVWKNEVTLWRDCVKKSPQKARPHANLANALLARGDTGEAVKECGIALRIRPDFAEAHLFLACALQARGDTDGAFEHFSRARRDRATAAVACNNMGSMLAMQGKMEKAREYFSAALAENPDYADAHINLARVLTRRGQAGKAVRHYIRALRIDPFNETAHVLLAAALEKQGRTPEAVFHYTAALKINPDHLQALNNLAWIYATARSPDLRNGQKAVKLAQHACALSGFKDPVYLDTLAAACAEVGRFEKARSTVRHALELAESANNRKLADAIKKRLELYRSGLPARAHSGRPI